MSEKILLTADPKAGYEAHAAEIKAAIDRVLAGGHYILGPEVEGFEREFAQYHGTGAVVTVANGTDAIELGLGALGVRPGDLVATVANTVSATLAGIQQLGAKPVFVEIDAATMVMSAVALEETLARHRGAVKAVVPVHLYGHPADMPALVASARRHGAKVLRIVRNRTVRWWPAGRRARGATRRPTVFTRRKTSARSATAGRSIRVMQPWRTACASCDNTAGGPAT
jgi:hypothetical protein